MEVKSLTKFARMSDKKVREIAREVQGLNAAEALEILKLVPRKSARLVAKPLASAIANAENNNGLSAANMKIKSAVVNQGIAFRRFRPVARGSAQDVYKRQGSGRRGPQGCTVLLFKTQRQNGYSEN